MSKNIDYKLKNIIGLKVVAIKGTKLKLKTGKRLLRLYKIEPEYILFKQIYNDNDFYMPI